MTGRFTTRGRPLAETVAAYLDGRSRGLTLHEVAAGLGIKWRSLRKALERARKRGLM